MKEQIIINGVLMEHTQGKSLSLVYQSPVFTDIDNIVSNRTNSIDFPATKNNLSAIDKVHLSGSESRFAYRKHKAIYLRDGVQVFSGYGTLMSVTPTAIKFTFTWGNIGAFQALLDYRLRDLKGPNGGEISIPWTDSYVSTSQYYFPSNVVTGGHQHPCMPMSTIMSCIESCTGVTIENKERFNDYRLMLTSKRANDASKVTQGVNATAIYRRSNYQYQNHDYIIPTGGTSDIRGLYLGEGIYNIEDFETLKVVIPAGFRYSCGAHTGRNDQQISIVAVDEDGNYAMQLAYIPLTMIESGSRYIYQVGSGLGTEKEVILNVKDYTHLMIKIREIGTAVSTETSIVSGSIRIIPDYDKEQELIYGGTFPMFYNMPDWTVSQLLKNLMKMEGLFASCPDEKTIRMLSVDTLYENRRNSLDLTDSLILDNGRAKEKTFIYKSYAQKNYFKYAEDETVKTNADGVIEIQNENIEKETDLVKLDFAPSDDLGGKVRIPLYTEDENGEVAYSDITPRILKISPKTPQGGKEILTFQDMDWPSLIASKYASFKSVITAPKVLKVSAIMHTLDLVNLDLSVPVYSYALGHHYAIISLTTKDNGVVDLELLQLVDETEQEELVDVNDAVLTVAKNADGEWVATLSNKSVSVINTIRNDKRYKVCLLRYGYARRGKYFKYTDRVGEKTNSKTSRKAAYDKTLQCAGYKHVRKEEGGGTPCWRRIGDEILKTGKLASHSQTKPYYGNSTLVFRLLDPIVLPPMRKNMKCKKSGRIHNKAKNGIAELSIGLFRCDDYGKWKCVSNICPIRSRTSTKTQYWEFNPNNVVG